MFVRGVNAMRARWLAILLLGAYAPCVPTLPLLWSASKEGRLPAFVEPKYGQTWEEFMLRTERAAMNHMLTYFLTEAYVQLEGRYPPSVRALCEWSASPLTCEQFRNPFTGKKYWEEEPTVPGHLEIVVQNAKAEVQVRFYREDEQAGLKVYGFRVNSSKQDPTLRTATPERRKAFVLGYVLESVVSSEPECVRKLGWEKLVERFPVLGSLRNPFTDAPTRIAQWIELQKEEELDLRGEAGEFAIIWRKGRHGWNPQVVIFGGNGEPLL